MEGTSVGALIFDKEGRILLMQRTDNSKFYKDCWLPPCGKVEEGESDSDALVREVMEETSMLVKVGKEVYSRINRNGIKEVVYLCEVNDGAPKIMEPNKCISMGYFSAEALPEGTDDVVSKVLEAYKNIKS